jgi:hypothetical protein
VLLERALNRFAQNGSEITVRDLVAEEHRELVDLGLGSGTDRHAK